METFRTALAAAGGWPVARLVLFGALPALASALAMARVPDTVPLVADLATARVRLDAWPGR